jgi:hypothetical protein
MRLDFSPEETGGLLPHTPVYLWRTGRGYRFLYPDHFARLAALARRVADDVGMRMVPLVAGLAAVGLWTLAARQRAPRAAPYVPLVVFASPWEAVGLAAGLALGWADTGYSWHLLNRARTHNAAGERFLGERPERFVVTNLWWVPQLYARASAGHSFFLLQSPGDYAKFRAFAVSRGERAWLLATGRQTNVEAPAEPLVVPGAPDRGTILDFRVYRLGAPEGG